MSDLERVLDKLFPLSRERPRLRYLDCPDTITGRHGESNSDGYCSWCGKKIASKAGPFVPDRNVLSIVQMYYGYMYDPDFGTSNWRIQ